MDRILSCFTNCYGPSGVHAAAEKIKAAGIPNLELALRGHNFGGLVIPEEAVITEKADDATAAAFRDKLKELGVGVSSCNINGGDMRTQEGLELTERRLRFARKWFGVDLVVSGASQPTTPEERRRIVEHLRRLGDTAAEQGVTVALETHAGPTQNADAMEALMFEVHHPNIRLNFDTGNILYYNEGADLIAQLEQVKKYVRSVHLKDSRGQAGDWYFPAVGDGGAVDFTRVREILDANGFRGPYTIEIEGIQGEEEPGLEGRQERIKRSAEHLRKCGYFV
ncbi:hypothetical protein BH23PLA1_BH23PLA1_34420 [soil metagenome]